MATLKLEPMPTVQHLAEDQAVASFEQRLQFPVIQEALFIQMLRLERRRAERSGRCFMLVLIEAGDFPRPLRAALLQRVAAGIAACTRETDVLGWYRRDATLGLLMTEIACLDKATIELLTLKIAAAVRRTAGKDTCSHLNLVFRVFPHLTDNQPPHSSDSILYPDLLGQR